ncbi:MAG: helix-turn-helix domain-containing protein [Candidatus Thorarchaeota archaeon]
MVGIILTEDELQTIFDILGLNENQSLVYMTLLSLGTLTLGQISQLTGINYIQVRECMDVLIGGEYVDWTGGKINRYFAREPFLKAFLLAYDPITLISIRDTTQKKIETIKKEFQTRINDQMALQEIQDLIKTQQKHIENEISALTFSIREMKRRLDILFQLSRKVSASTTKSVSGLTTDVIYGETTFILVLRDMASRAKVSLTLLMPYPEIQTLITTSKLSLSVCTRTLIVGNFNKVPKNILNKVLASKIRMKQSTVNFWGCVRDNEEVLIGPAPEVGEEMDELIGIISTNPMMVRFFGQQISSLTSKGQDLKLE